MASITDFSMSLFSLKGKNAIVTGGNGGLGQAFSLALAKAGANVLVPSLVDDGGETRGLIEEAGVRFEFMQIDITQEGAPKQVIDHCVEVFGAVDILVVMRHTSGRWFMGHPACAVIAVDRQVLLQTRESPLRHW